jgi:TonB family protein
VKAISRETNDTSTSSYVADYALQMMIELLNKTDKRITGLGLKFINIESRQVFFSYPHINGIEPQGSYQVQFGLMTISGNPTNLLVELVGVRFDGGKTGGAFPAHPPLPFASTVPVNPQVDSKPRPLNRLRPTYTDEARKNKITGAVRLRLEVGADGSVKNVYVLNALPDGLTEEAIRIVKVLQFQPAMRNGSPVEYAIVMEIEFDLL